MTPPTPVPELHTPDGTEPHRTTSVRSVALGVLGALLVAGLVVTVDLAGADAEPALDTVDATGPAGPVDPTDADASADGGPADDAGDDPWIAYEACVDSHLDAAGVVDPYAWPDPSADPSDDDTVTLELPDPALFDTFDQAWDAADRACRDRLPDDLRAELEAWDAYDACIDRELRARGLLDDGPPVDIPLTVSVDGPSGFQIVELGDGPATVTITSDGSTVEVSVDGDAELVDLTALDAEAAIFDEEFEAAFAACDPLLPADMVLEPGAGDPLVPGPDDPAPPVG